MIGKGNMIEVKVEVATRIKLVAVNQVATKNMKRWSSEWDF